MLDMLRRLLRRTRAVSPDDVILAARTIAACLQTEQEDHEAALQTAGFDAHQAVRFASFLPMAFARPVLEQLGVSQFSPTVSVDLVDGRTVNVRLDHQPEYVAGLRLARKHRRIGSMPQDIFAAVAGSSANINSVDNALNAGMDIQGSTIASALVGRYRPEDFIW